MFTLFLLNVSENRGCNHEWKIQRHGQHCAHKTHDEDKQKQHSTESNRDEQQVPHQMIDIIKLGGGREPPHSRKNSKIKVVD